MPYQCSKCNKAFASDLARHSHCIAKKDHHYCEECHTIFPSAVLLGQHIVLCPGVPQNSDTETEARVTVDHIGDFFGQYPSFHYDSDKEIMSQFNELSRFFHWGRYNEEKEEARQMLRDAIVKTFNDIYGEDIDDINVWHRLCQVIHIHPIPDGISRCREVVKQTHVNLIDLVETARNGDVVQIFPTEVALSAYTRGTGKYFPKENAYAGGVLRFLLRRIMDPRSEVEIRGSGRGRGGHGSGGGQGRGRRGRGGGGN